MDAVRNVGHPGIAPGNFPPSTWLIAHRLNDVLANDAIICCDTGTVTTWAARHIKIRGTMEFSASGTLATMACSLPYAVGAAVAHPGRQVVCFTGDGGFTMLMGELATIVKYRLPIKIIVVKNNVLGMIKWEQQAMEGNPQYGVELQPIDFAALARLWRARVHGRRSNRSARRPARGLSTAGPCGY